MKKHILKIREVDRMVFEAIKNGEKAIETRANTAKFRNIKTGDVLMFACGKDKLEKQVKKAEQFTGIDEMVRAINFKKVMPFVNSIEEMKGVYYSFPSYKEKIAKFGLVAFYLE